MQPTTKASEAAVDTGDRLSFALFLAAALHGLLILGLGFNVLNESETPPTFEVTLATHKSQQAPDDADYQAQFNQEASGTKDEARELSTDSPAPFADTQVNEVRPPPEFQKQDATEARDHDRLVTDDSPVDVAEQTDAEAVENRESREGGDRQQVVMSREIASLRAKLDRLQQSYAQRPRITTLSSVATIGSPEAEYLYKWQEKVESVGNRNFPQEALQQRIFGQLRLATVVRADGTIVSVEISKSSGHSILDNAALQIVHQAAPFAPFPPEISKEWDQLEIVRTWRFEIDGLSTTAK